MEKNIVKIKKINKNFDTIEIIYEYGTKLNDYFLEKKFFVKYSESIEDIPEGILIIPFIGNIIPVIWLTDSILIIDEIDKNYYECLEKVKKSYAKMYKEVEFLGELKVNKIEDYGYIPQNRVCQLFSGGVDSVATYVSIKNYNPELITIWGADIGINNNKAWKKVEISVKEFGKNENKKNIIIKSNFRRILNEKNLNISFQKKIKDNWWHGIQHGIALLSLVIPYAYKNRMSTIYIPSSYSDINIRCASHPTIDEKIKYGGKVIHEGFKYTRQEKLKLIANYLNETNDKNMKLRVCWEGVKGTNCSQCEKCLRTIVGLFIAGIDPNKVGFNIKKEEIKDIIDNKKILLEVEFWNEIKEALKISKLRDEEWINWLLELDISKYNDETIKKMNIFFKIKRKLKYYIKRYILKTNIQG